MKETVITTILNDVLKIPTPSDSKKVSEFYRVIVAAVNVSYMRVIVDSILVITRGCLTGLSRCV